jgi:hypothetical protein
MVKYSSLTDELEEMLSEVSTHFQMQGAELSQNEKLIAVRKELLQDQSFKKLFDVYYQSA